MILEMANRLQRLRALQQIDEVQRDNQEQDILIPKFLLRGGVDRNPGPGGTVE